MSARDKLNDGLTDQQAQKKLEEHGLNQLASQKKHSSLLLLFSQFKSPLIYILLIAGLATSFYGKLTDSVVIFAAIFLNTVLGFYQEVKAQKSMEALRGLLSPRAKVVRDGVTKEIPAQEVVPGDIAILTIGARVPADGWLVEAKDLSVSEAILTGESMPVEKFKINPPSASRRDGEKLKIGIDEIGSDDLEQENQVFMGTIVSTGIGRMLVTRTGMVTRMGRIGQQVESIEEEKTPLQVQLGQMARVLALVVGLIAGLIFIFGWLQGYEPIIMFETSVAVAVAAIPEGLVVTLTVILALGMQRILKREAIVRKLLAAETLGSVTVICADKTGTLTEGKMRVVESVTGLAKKPDKKEEKKQWMVKAAVLCNDMRDPLEVGMWEWAEEEVKGQQLEVKSLLKQYARLDEIPFSPEYKYIATLNEAPVDDSSVRKVIFVSGAPEVVLRRCRLSQKEIKGWLEKFEELGSNGYRLVGFAYRKAKTKTKKLKSESLKNLEWLGVLIYEDPVRPGVNQALQECRKAGIRVRVITGDYASTAVAVLTKLGLKIDPQTQLMTGDELASVSDFQLKEKVDEIVLFARTTPEQKLKIVESLKERGEVVAMTGDGVNDAPALARADIGIVVGEASDVAKQSADMVLLDSDFKTIVAAIEEGRIIFENIKKVVLYLLSGSFAEVFLVGGSLLLGLPLPVTAAQILWVNLVEDVLPGMALAFEADEKDLMKLPPRPRGAVILDLQMRWMIMIIGATLNLILLALTYWLSKGLFHLQHVQTVIFIALGIDSLFVGFACRNLRKPFFRYPLFSNHYLNLSVSVSFLLLLAAVYLPPLQKVLGTKPLDAKEWFLLFVLGIVSFLTIEITKWAVIIRKKQKAG